MAAQVHDAGPMFWVDIDPRVGPMLVHKATGGAWYLRAEPPNRAVFAMPSAAMIDGAMRAAGVDPARPHDMFPFQPPPPSAPTTATVAEVAAWLRAEYGWRHIEDRITDRGWAYSVNTQSDAFLDTGDPNDALIGNGPIIVVKRTRGIWFFGSNPILYPAMDATNEIDFYVARRAVFRNDDPSRPDRLLPTVSGR
ncbi:YrhB domain-containing protein [Amycolatopsis albispora]|uniref:Immunity protein 35 domain-containing protein n=1 Tax=Amycolatopsis albispora TaxID=1804986 RepID=A0A344L5B6_9PSEU|nr:YrhB domain-containing protein [Amycolatopsis albispora]AXB43240.1 hypothetical protein A4R43_12330 [Amycolatopsis albispora]